MAVFLKKNFKLQNYRLAETLLFEIPRKNKTFSSLMEYVNHFARKEPRFPAQVQSTI